MNKVISRWIAIRLADTIDIDWMQSSEPIYSLVTRYMEM